MTVFKNNIISILTNPIKLGIIFVLPFLFIMLFLLGNASSIPTRVVILDYDDTRLTRSLINEIKKSNVIIDCKEDEIVDNLINAKVDYALTINSGYTDAILSGKDAYITQRFFINEEKLYPLMMNIENYINNAINLNSVAKDRDDFHTMLNDVNDYNLEYSQDINETASVQRTVDALGFMTQFILYCSIMIAALLLIDKETNAVTRIVVSPKSHTRYIIEHFLSYVVLQLFVVTYLIATLKIGFNYTFEGNFILILSMMMLFSISIIALAIMIVSICKKSQLSYWVMVFLTTPLIMLGGCYFDISGMPDIIQNAAKFLPTRWIMLVVRDILLYDTNENVLKSVAVFIAFTVVFLSISRIGLKSLMENK